MIGDVIYDLLSNDTDVSALVSTRIYPSLAIENVVYPYIVYEQNNNDPTNDKDGKSVLDTLGYHIQIYTKTLAESNDLGIKVRNVLDRYSGTVSGKVIQSVKYTDENSGYSDADRVHLKMQNYDFRYKTIYLALGKVLDLAQSANTDTTIDLTWSDVATGETGYEVWRGADFISWTLIATTSADATTYQNTGLTADSAFTYKIRPTDGTNGGEWSNVIVANTETAATNDTFIKSHFDISTDTTDLAVIDSDSAGVYTSISDDGSSGTITISFNGGSFVAFSTLNPLTLVVGNTIQEKRTVTTGAGFAKLTGTF